MGRVDKKEKAEIREKCWDNEHFPTERDHPQGVKRTALKGARSDSILLYLILFYSILFYSILFYFH